MKSVKEKVVSHWALDKDFALVCGWNKQHRLHQTSRPINWTGSTWLPSINRRSVARSSIVAEPSTCPLDANRAATFKSQQGSSIWLDPRLFFFFSKRL
jgi:hypothetical protein